MIGTALSSLLICGSSVAQSWACYGGSAQHRSVSPALTQPLNRVLWSTPVDLSPDYQGSILGAHYGSPVITKGNTIIVPVKVGLTDGFRVEARNGTTGALVYSLDSDYTVATGSSWMPSYGPALDHQNQLYMPAAGGTVLVRKNADATGIGPMRVVFFGPDNYVNQKNVYDAYVKISTPLTIDGKDNAWFGFRTYGQAEDETPIGRPGLLSGIARVDSKGNGVWKSAKAICGDPDALRIQLQCAPAITGDNSLVYFAVQLRYGGGYLVGIDGTTLETKYRVRLVDPGTGNDAIVTNQSSASPTIGPDGDVYFGVLSNPEQGHNKRGYLLHFDKTLTTLKLCGSFGWDSTASVISTSALPGYKGPSSYLLVTKYNNYAGFGDGVNKVALLDPNVAMEDPISSINVMSEVETMPGVSQDPTWVSPDYPNAVYEWCVNAAAVDPASHSVLINSEDGRLYRWDLLKNEITEGVLMEGPRGQAYTPVITGPTGISYAINNGKLFAIGK